jgi:LPS-assembly protein
MDGGKRRKRIPELNRRTCGALLAGGTLAAVAAAAPVHAQLGGVRGSHVPPISRTAPVFYQADRAEYDREAGIVTLSGHVEIWQGERDLRADRVTYDRNTGVAAASGHVVLLDPGGEVVFADYAELSQGMKDGVLTNLRAQLAENGRLAANGARRVDAQINELSRVIYSTCNVCQQHPDEAPLWDLRARTAVQDVENKRIEYRDAVVDIYGVPIAYFPYFTHPDPSAKRASGFLVPSLGISKYLGAYTDIPYYWVIDDSTDATIAPVLTAEAGGALDLQLRHRFNNGTVTVNTSVAYDHQRGDWDLFTKGQFAINDEWRWGFDLQRASSVNYLRDFRVSGYSDVLTSQVYLEGFGQGSYARLDARAYQGLSSSIISARLPYVLPRYEYRFFGEPDALGGRTSVDAGAFNVLRQQGTNTQRADLRLDWERPATGAMGDLWKLVLHLDTAAYAAHQLDQNPTFGPRNAASTAQAMPTLALDMHWPLQRDAGSWGTQVVEPIMQLIAAPNGSSYGLATRPNGTQFINSLVPNEDSLDFDFTDANLFSLNRFPGVDRLEGGMRANVALHGAWYFPDAEQIDAQIGQGYRLHKDTAFPVGSGLDQTVSDVVGHISYMPNPWFDVATHERFDHRSYRLRFADAVASAGPSWLRLSGGYLYSSYNPFFYYDTIPTGSVNTTSARNEVTLGATTRYGPWRLSANARRDVQTNKMVTAGLGAAYEDECFVFDVEFFRRYVSLNGDNGASTVLFQVTFKTVGTFGFHGL